MGAAGPSRGARTRPKDPTREAAEAPRAPANDAIAVLNAGSSSLKFSVFDADGEALALVVRGQAEALTTQPRFVAKDANGVVLDEKALGEGASVGHAGALDHLVAFLRRRLGDKRLVGIGHRVVHGGPEYAAPVRVDRGVLDALDKYVPLAPLHQPHNLAPIRLLAERLPDVPQVACFDTAFHRRQPAVAQAFALPKSITDRGVLRYGFHGLSYEYIAGALRSVDERAADGKTVVLHLGNGSSMCAIDGGRSVASTMGFTAVDGLPMGTRCGSLDPGVVLWLMDEMKMDARAIEKLVYQQSGLLGVSGVSSDMRTLEASDAPGAKEAIDLYVYRIGRELGSLAAALGGVDAIVFTAGIGENSRLLRERVCRDAAWLGVELDVEANRRHATRISKGSSRTAAYVIPTNEELMIASHARALLAPARVKDVA
jgi:acetate kinase